MKVHALLCFLPLVHTDAGDSDRGIDLLRRVDPGRDALRGSWRVEGTSLVMEPMSRLQVPWTAPDEFDLVLDVERLHNVGKLLVGLGAFDVVIDNWHANEHRAGAHRLDGRHVTAYPARVGAVFRNNVLHRILYSVRKASVVVKVDGLEILRFEGDLGRLSLDPRYVPPTPRAFFVANETSPFRILRMSLRPMEGRGTSIASCPAPLNQARWRCGTCGRVTVAFFRTAPICHDVPMKTR
ncbi:MAG TPA: hypothetical protein VF950_29470 [Planctomycetota bacterium]